MWVGAGSLGRRSGRVALYFRDDARWLGPPPVKGDPPGGAPACGHPRAAWKAGAAFWTDLLADLAEAEPVELQEALWDLVWAGEVTNDAFAPLRAPRLALARRERDGGRRFARRRRPGAPQVQGRWSLTAPLFAGCAAVRPADARARRGAARALRDRDQGDRAGRGDPRRVRRDVRGVRQPGDARHRRRGYFVEGLGGAQFALPAAIERLRSLRADEPAGAQVLAATDPANAYGAALPWPRRDDESSRRPARVPGAYVVTLDAEPALYVERGGKGLVALRDPDESWLRPALEALAEAVRRGRVARLGLERFDGEPVVGTPVGALLVELGFRQGPRKLTLSA